jgi:hypothetical protein
MSTQNMEEFMEMYGFVKSLNWNGYINNDTQKNRNVSENIDIYLQFLNEKIENTDNKMDKIILPYCIKHLIS